MVLRLAAALLLGAVLFAPGAHSETQGLAESRLSAEGLKRVGDGFDFPGPHSGFGLGFAVRRVATAPLPAGEYRWDGVGGTFFFVDPRDDLLAIVMMQSPSRRSRIQVEMKKLIYEALGK